ncbi:MAG: hypothetical protein P8M22_02250 [Phycisphaerales bacterium]|nr:hypothetical protein [Phycisphaerales bacterium]
MPDDTRIESLETQVRTLKRMLFGVFGLVIVGGLLAATSLQSIPDVVQAKKFEVVNDAGKVCAELATNANGSQLKMFNKDGNLLAIFGANANGGELFLSNTDDKQVAGIFADTHGGVMLISNKDGKRAAVVFADKNGAGTVATSDGKGVETSRNP